MVGYATEPTFGLPFKDIGWLLVQPSYSSYLVSALTRELALADEHDEASSDEEEGVGVDRVVV